MVNKTPAYWAQRRTKTYGKLYKNGVNAVMDPSVGNIARAAWSGVKAIRALINVEKHEIYQTLTTSVNSTGIVEPITNTIALGTLDSNRIGDSIKLINYMEHNIFNMSNLDVNVTFREIVFSYNDIATPVISDVLMSAAVNSFYNPDNKQNYRILYDKKYHLCNAGKSGIIPSVKLHFKNHHVKWKLDSTSQRTGQLYRILLSDTVNNMGRETRLRLTFTDN